MWHIVSSFVFLSGTKNKDVTLLPALERTSTFSTHCIVVIVPGDYETWKYIAPIQNAAWERKRFEYGTWGGEIRDEFKPKAGEIVAAEHWCSSGFANTDLDLQLKKHGIHKLMVLFRLAK
ncbi:MAG TPA: isochorismatase family protein [Candidatus Acidoferrales bacterium]|nr:isochorismatase family protein [Candidatus Acidoferrales bacterium]